MQKSNLHSADGSFLGFLFQIERALLWLSEGGEGGKIGIETDDDIVVQLKRGLEIETIYEQAKNTQKQKLAYSDLSEDLWKTLHIWVSAAVEGRVDPKKSIFSAVTNKKIPITRLLTKLHLAKMDNEPGMTDIVATLKATAKKLSKDNKKYGETIINCDEAILKSVIDKIEVYDGSFHHSQSDFKKKLKQNLSIGDKLPFDHIYNNLLGHVTETIINCWRSNEEAWLEVNKFNNLYNDLVTEFNKKTFIENATEFLPVNRKEIEKNKKKLYVEQLKAINCTEDELLEAIHDYIRASSEKNRYAKEFEITSKKFELYYEDLKKYWNNISSPRFRIRENFSNEDIGYKVYNETTLYKGKLNKQEPEQSYTYKGAFHYLANETEIGWHPEWIDLFKKKKNG